MLTHISIENFKGIRERVDVELKPITLLFGPNSAGKSTILHALLYAQEVFERHNLNADTTVAGGPFINLGGFKRMVHGHDLSLSISLGLRFNFEEGEWKDHKVDKDASDAFQFFLGCPAERLLAAPTSAGVFLRICWAEEVCKPFVQSCRLQLDSVDFAEITAAPFLESRTPNSPILHLPNLDHPLLLRVPSGSSCVEALAGEEPCEYVAGAPASATHSVLHLALKRVGFTMLGWNNLCLIGEEDALIRSESSIQFGKQLPLKSKSIEAADSRNTTKAEIRAFLDSTVTGILRSLRNRLMDFRYLGPVREIPSRNATPPSSPDPRRWSTGLGAWDHLQTCDAPFVEEVSSWLSDPGHLNAGVRLARRDLIPLDLAKQVLADLMSKHLGSKERDFAAKQLDGLPIERRVFVVPNDSDIELSLHDVGVGISQLVPVLVTALDRSVNLAAIEKPEYHLHPRLQAELGDLLIESAVGRKTILLVETHSEHLVLRIQRRIRETSASKASPEHAVTTDDIAVYHVRQTTGQALIRRIDVDRHGEFVQPWPDDFFELDFYERFH